MQSFRSYIRSIFILKQHTMPGITSKCSTHKNIGANEDINTENVMIVGLGNQDFPDTRHSIGMRALNQLAAQLNLKWTKERRNCAGFVTSLSLNSETQLILLKPKVPMNINGTSVKLTANYFGISAERILLVHDDLDKRVGKVSMKYGGSANGHNGVKSVMNSLQTDALSRVRIGIDRPSDKSQIVPYVLGKFRIEEELLVKKAINKSIILITTHLQEMTGTNLNHISKSVEHSEERTFNNDMEDYQKETVTTLQSEIQSDETTNKDKFDRVENS